MSATSPELRMTQLIDGPVEAVFRAWTDPHVLTQWWGPGTFVTSEAELDVRPGGSYRIRMGSQDGSRTLGVTGTYREVEPPRRLVFTWSWEDGDPHAYSSVVTVELRPQGARTELVLTHGGFTDAAAAEPYADGWRQSLPNLVALFSSPAS